MNERLQIALILPIMMCGILAFYNLRAKDNSVIAIAFVMVAVLILGVMLF